MTSERLSHFTNEQGEKQTCNVEMRSDQDVSVLLPLVCQPLLQDQDVPVFFTSYLPSTCTRQRRPCFFTSCFPSTCTRQRGLCFFTSCLPSTSTRPRYPCLFYLLFAKHLYKAKTSFLPLASQAPVQEDLLQPRAWRRTTGSRSDHERAEYGAVRISWKSSYSDDRAGLNLMN